MPVAEYIQCSITICTSCMGGEAACTGRDQAGVKITLDTLNFSAMRERWEPPCQKLWIPGVQHMYFYQLSVGSWWCSRWCPEIIVTATNTQTQTSGRELTWSVCQCQCIVCRTFTMGLPSDHFIIQWNKPIKYCVVWSFFCFRASWKK